MAHCTISVFDIPLLVELICDYLTPDDYQRCRRVSRGWNMAFKRHTWRSIHAVLEPRRYDDHPLCFSPQQRSKIIQHAHLVHALQMSLDSEVSFLANCSWSQLRKLEIHNYLNWRLWNMIEKREEYFAQMAKTATTLLQHCPRLLSLTVYEFERDNEYSQLDSFTGLTPTMCNLNSLSLLQIKYRQFPSILKLIHETCPDTLVELNLSIYPEQARRYFGLPADLSSTPPSGHSCSGRQLSLQRIKITNDYTHGDIPEFLAVPPFLKHCPELFDLSLPRIKNEVLAGKVVSTLIDHCPKIKRFDLKCHPDWFEHSQRLLAAYTGLETFSFEQGPVSHYSKIMDFLLDHSAHTLEVLTMHDHQFLTRSDMCRILNGFPNLKNLTIESVEGYEDYPPVDICVQENQFTIQDLLWGPTTLQDSPVSFSSSSSVLPVQPWMWACQNLESLTLPIVFLDSRIHPRLSFSHPLNSASSCEMSMLSIQFLELLLSLPKLKDLHLNWLWHWTGASSRKPSHHVIGLLGLVQGYKGIGKKLDVDWINQENLDWVGIDNIFNREVIEAEYGGCGCFYCCYGMDEWYGDWSPWGDWSEDPEDYGIVVRDRNMYRKTDKSRCRRRIKRREGGSLRRIK